TASAHSPSGHRCIATPVWIRLRHLNPQCAFIIAIASPSLSPSPFISVQPAEALVHSKSKLLSTSKSKYEFIPPNHVHARKTFEKRGASLLKNLLAKARTNSLGRLPTPIELFERTHKHKDETWVDKSEHFSAEFNHAKEEATQKAAEDGSSAPDEIDLWCDIAEVK
ncbi:hypothetical protein PIB30_033904, partial [Stylosanthes scabra]|nr:hypothetical protein [Stylosanthes scabra]